MFTLENHRIVITGAAGGIGLATALECARAGATVTMLDVDQARLDAAASKVGEVGNVATTHVADVRDAEQVRAAVDAAADVMTGIDVLVNNAGIECVGALDELSLESIERSTDINLLGVLLMTRAALPYLRDSDRAAIVNVSSQAAKRGTPSVGVYSAAKAGVLGWARSAAVEWAPTIRVNSVCPGVVDTPMMDRHYDTVTAMGIDRDEERARFAQAIPMGRTQQPVDIARAVVFLAGPWASQITGQALNVDGGMVMD